MSKAKTESRCSGHCCADFTIPYSPEEIKRRYAHWKRGETKLLFKSAPRDLEDPIVNDIDLIYPMLIYLGHYASPSKEFVNAPIVEPSHHYTCKHYDKKTHNCTIYDIRPGMCSEYPYASTCNYSACTWTDRKQKKLSKPKTHAAEQLVQLGAMKVAARE